METTKPARRRSCQVLSWAPPCAEVQSSVFTRNQAYQAGLSRGAANHRIDCGAWQPVAGHGWALAEQDIGLLQGAWAAMLTWPDAVLWGPTALRLHQPQAPLPADGSIHVVLPHSRGHLYRLTVHQRPESWHRCQVQAGLRLSSQLDAVADCLTWLSRDQADQLVAWLVTRRIVLPDQFGPTVQTRRKHRGVVRLDQYQRQFDGRAASPLELDVQLMLRQADITGWKANAPIRIKGRLAAAADLLFERQRLILECDGYAYHSGREAFERDRARDSLLQANGYNTIRLTYDRIRNDRAKVLAEIKKALTQPFPKV